MADKDREKSVKRYFLTYLIGAWEKALACHSYPKLLASDDPD